MEKSIRHSHRSIRLLVINALCGCANVHISCICQCLKYINIFQNEYKFAPSGTQFSSYWICLRFCNNEKIAFFRSLCSLFRETTSTNTYVRHERGAICEHYYLGSFVFPCIRAVEYRRQYVFSLPTMLPHFVSNSILFVPFRHLFFFLFRCVACVLSLRHRITRTTTFCA